ncbi:MAG: alpha/beta hydrolase [Flavobacteriales bacterium]
MKINGKNIGLIFILGVLFLHFYAPKFITEIQNPIIKTIRKLKGVKQNPKLVAVFPEGKLWTYKSEDHLDLKVLYYPTSLDSVKGNIILVHGIRGDMNFLEPNIRHFSSLGYNTFSVDLRAHGSSGGQYCTFGVKEKKDISNLIDYLLEFKHLDLENLGIWAQSLGGAVALQSLAVDKRIQWGIVESTFSEFTTIVNDYFQLYLGFSNVNFSNYLVKRAGAISNFNPDEAKPINACRKITQPVLMIHGTEDDRINISNGKRNFQALSSKNKSFFEVKGANHVNVWHVGDIHLKNEINVFLKRVGEL